MELGAPILAVVAPSPRTWCLPYFTPLTHVTHLTPSLRLCRAVNSAILDCADLLWFSSTVVPTQAIQALRKSQFESYEPR